jgi:hypothetical protein
MRTRWERFGKWLFGIFCPRLETDVEILKMRLAATHERMQALYWDGKAKELAQGRIEALEEAAYKLSSWVLYLCKEKEHKPGCICQGVWDFIGSLGLNPPVEQIKASVDKLAEDRANGPKEELPEGLLFDHLGRHGTFPDPENLPEALNRKIPRVVSANACVYHGMDPLGWCRTHNKQCLTPAEFIERVKSAPGPVAYKGCSHCMKPKHECVCPEGFRP